MGCARGYATAQDWDNIDYGKDFLQIAHKSMLKTDPDRKSLFVVAPFRGNFALGRAIIDRIEKYIAKDDKVIFLGDNIGDTKYTLEIIKLLKEYQEKRPDQVVMLRGLAENRMAIMRPQWLTSKDGMHHVRQYTFKTAGRNSRNYIDSELLWEHRSWLQSTPYFYMDDKYFICNSGPNPAMSLEDQVQGSLLYQDKVWSQSEKTYDKRVVFACKDSKIVLKSSDYRIGVGSDDKNITAIWLTSETKKQEPSVVVDMLKVSQLDGSGKK